MVKIGLKAILISLSFLLCACGGTEEGSTDTSTNNETTSSIETEDNNLVGMIQACEVVEVTAATLNVRINANTNDAPVGVVEAGEQYVVVGRDGSWVNIWYDENTRWVGGNYTSTLSLPCGKVVNTNSLNVRAGESSGSDLVGTAEGGSLWVYVNNLNDDEEIEWKNIWYKSESRYVHGSYLDENTQDEAKPAISVIVNDFKINNGATSTSSVFVTLNSAINTNATHYQASEKSNLSDATWTAYSSSVNFTLSAGNEDKEVYFRVKNSEGRLSEIVSANISLNVQSSKVRQIDSEAFFSKFRAFYGPLTSEQVTGLNYLIANFEVDTESAYTNLTVWQRQISYLLATTKHEVANRYTPITEYGSQYCKNYSGGCTYKGRGYVQLTHDYNYQAMGPITGANLLAYPERALEPDIAYRVMSYGSFHGIFTSRKLGDYVKSGLTDYYNARRVINGTDKASLIKGYAEQFQSIMEHSSI